MDNKRPRTLEDLKEQFVEKRRKKYLERIETFTLSDHFEHLLDFDDFSIHSKEINESNKLDYLSINKTNIHEILVFPEYITCLDSLINEEVEIIKNSFFFIRPEGSRSLIYIRNYFATVYNKEGVVKDTFKIDLKGPTVLDCVYYPYNNDYSLKSDGGDSLKKVHIYYIMDVLILNGCILTTAELECRLFFMNSILEELNSCTNVLFKRVRYYEVDSNELESLYSSIKSKAYEYETDSILFVSKNSIYIGGYNPNWLCYKDSILNKYCKCENVICKLYNNNNELHTYDNVFIGNSSEEFKDKIVRINVTNFHDFKVSYGIIGDSNAHKNPDSLRKIYVNYINHKHTNDNFNKLLRYLKE